jgi:hypothetical protein
VFRTFSSGQSSPARTVLSIAVALSSLLAGPPVCWPGTLPRGSILLWHIRVQRPGRYAVM